MCNKVFNRSSERLIEKRILVINTRSVEVRSVHNNHFLFIIVFTEFGYSCNFFRL